MNSHLIADTRLECLIEKYQKMAKETKTDKQEAELKTAEIELKKSEVSKTNTDTTIAKAQLIVDALSCYEVETNEAGVVKYNSPFTQAGKDILANKLIELVKTF